MDDEAEAVPIQNKVMKMLLVIIRTAEVIAALGADQLAVVAGELMGTVGADLAVMLDRLRGRVDRLTMWDFTGKIGIEGAGPLRQHGGQISMEGKAPAAWSAARRLMYQHPGGAEDFPTAALSTGNRISNPPRRDLWQARQVRFGQDH
jgi:hypothetical protein